jgi:hypothetical protein
LRPFGLKVQNFVSSGPPKNSNCHPLAHLLLVVHTSGKGAIMNEEELERLRDVAEAAANYRKAERLLDRLRAIWTTKCLENDDPGGFLDDPEIRAAIDEMVRCQRELDRALWWLAKLNPPD